MGDKLYFVKATQDEMYDLGNIKPITHFLLYNQTHGIAVDITSDIKQAPLLSAVQRMQVMPTETVTTIERLMAEGTKEPPKGMEVTPVTFVKKFEYKELVGEQYQSVADAMVKLKGAKNSLDDVVASLESSLLVVGIITPKPVIVEPERIAAIDPTSLDTPTQARIELIVDAVKNDHFKAGFYTLIGDTAKAKKYSTETVATELERRNVIWTAEALLHHFEVADRQGINEAERKKLAQKVYQLAQKEEKYDIELKIAKEVLQLPENVIIGIQEKRLHKVMTTFYGHRDDSEEEMPYIAFVRQAAEGLSPERVKAIAEKSYKSIMAEKRGFGGSNYLAAGKLAKEFALGNERVIEAGRQLVSTQLKDNYAGGYVMVESAFTSLELPEEVVHPAMVRFFTDALWQGNDKAKEIAQKHSLRDTEISVAVNQAYTQYMQVGHFERALAIRKEYPVIQDNRVKLEDLQTLVGVLQHRQD